MLENDDAQEFIWELIDEVVDNADKQIYKKYIEKQTIPYTINEAKNAIVHLIDVCLHACKLVVSLIQRFFKFI